MKNIPEIKLSHEYDSFLRIMGNRVISRKKVDRIKDDVQSGLNLFPYCPIVVSKNTDGTLNIIDGQHRFTACKELEFPIYYVVATDIKLRDIARMNSNTDKWKYSDFMRCYIDLGLSDYQVLKDFNKNHRVNLRMGVSLLMNGRPGNNSKDAKKFSDGDFKVKTLDFATDFIALIDRLFDRYSFSRHNYLLEAVYKLQKKGLWDLEVMETKINSHPNMMDKMASTKNYIYLLEQIYNVRAQKRTTIF